MVHLLFVLRAVDPPLDSWKPTIWTKRRVADLPPSSGFGNSDSLTGTLTMQATRPPVMAAWARHDVRRAHRYSQGRRPMDDEERVNGQPTQF
jgi:hypothetical protein